MVSKLPDLPSSPPYRPRTVQNEDKSAMRLHEAAQPAPDELSFQKNESQKERVRGVAATTLELPKTSKQRAQEILDTLIKTSPLKGVPSVRSTPYTAEELIEVKKRLYRTKDDL